MLMHRIVLTRTSWYNKITLAWVVVKWSSGQRARLLLLQSEFESCARLQFFL